VLSMGPKEEALKKDHRGEWGTIAYWQHLDRTSNTSTVIITQQRCVSRRFVKFVRLCVGPSSSSLAVLAAALHCFRSLSRPDSLSPCVSLPPSLFPLFFKFEILLLLSEADGQRRISHCLSTRFLTNLFPFSWLSRFL
jgi:hypothetical protein